MRVLHVPFQFTSGELGGTEIYVAALCKWLTSLGVESAIAAPANSSGFDIVDKVPIHYFGTDPKAGFDQAYGRPDAVAATNFRYVLAAWRPEIVHLHARSAAVSELLVEEARLAGCRIVYTYHTPTASCARGTMMHMGNEPCDGVLDITRCTSCVLQKYGVSAAPRFLLARTPIPFGKLLARTGREGGIWTALRLRTLIAEGHSRFYQLMNGVDKVVGVCNWVAQVMRSNGVLEPKLFVSRQGLPNAPTQLTAASPVALDHRYVRRASAPFKIRYFGRIDQTKGLDLLARALSFIPHSNVTLEIYGIRQGEMSAFSKHLDALLALDPRIVMKSPLAAEQVVAAMRECDLVAVPSQWLETGPLVVLEAFAAGTPVIGSRLGGITELVRNGVDGILVEARDACAWARAIADIEADHSSLQAFRDSIRPPRTTKHVADEMHSLYRELI